MTIAVSITAQCAVAHSFGGGASYSLDYDDSEDDYEASQKKAASEDKASWDRFMDAVNQQENDARPLTEGSGHTRMPDQE